MKLKRYGFEIGVLICVLCLGIWIAFASQTVLLTPGFGAVTVILPDGVPDFLNAPGMRHIRDLGKVIVFENIVKGSVYEIWVFWDEPVVLGIVSIGKEGDNKHWIYPYAKANHSGEPASVNIDKFNWYMETLEKHEV